MNLPKHTEEYETYLALTIGRRVAAAFIDGTLSLGATRDDVDQLVHEVLADIDVHGLDVVGGEP